VTYHWLLDVQIDGVPYRWTSASDGAEVTTAGGEVYWYAAGLDDLRLAPGDVPDIEIYDESVGWASLAVQLQGRRVTLRRWLEGDLYERAEVYATGLASTVSYEPDAVTMRIEEPPALTTYGAQVPDPLARVDADTFPTAVATDIGPDIGAAYPVILGYPGWQEDTATNVPVVPLPLAQWDANDADTWVVVSEDGSLPIVGCRVRNDELDVTGTEDVKVVTDLLGRVILVADFANDTAPKPTTATERAPLLAAFVPNLGGGPRPAYDAIVYMLQRWGPLTVDWRRMPEVRTLLAPYLIDCWITSPISDPWLWVAELVVDLPVEIRTGQQGRYLVPSRYLPDSALVTRDLTIGVDLERDGPVELTEPINEFVALYRQGPTGDWLGSVVLTGAPGEVLSAPGRGAPTGARVIASSRCRSSVAQYGLRPAGEPVHIDWTWDLGTVVRVLEHRAARDALPARLVSVVGDESLQLREGERIRLTDDELGLSGLAVVDEPPTVSSRGVEAVLRMA
jgi:hypothetical protein